MWECPNCGELNDDYCEECEYCGCSPDVNVQDADLYCPISNRTAKTADSTRTLTLTNGKNEVEVGAVGMSKFGIGISASSDPTFF